MNNDELRQGIDEIKSALNILDADLTPGGRPLEGVRDLGLAVDNIRRNVWAVLKAEHSGDYHGYLGKTRVRRATETCEDVLSDLYAETIAPNTPGLEVFHATLRELAKACSEIDDD